MATTKGLKFFHVAGLPEKAAAVVGGIYFDTTKGEISVYNGTDWEKYSGNVKNVTYNDETKKLTITYFNGNPAELDFSDVASKTQVATDIETAKNAAIVSAKTYADGITVNGKSKAEGSQDITVGGADIALTGYTMAASKEAIKTTDSVNTAIGKLEKAIEATDGNALIEVEKGNGIDVSAKTNNKQTISVKIDEASEKFGENAVLTAGPDGLKISGISGAISAAIGKLDKDDTAIDGKYVSSVKEVDGIITVTRADLPVTGVGVKTGDKILSISGNNNKEISAGLSFEYVDADRKIYLYGSAKDADHKIGEVDCTAFIKDGILYDQKVAKASGTSMEITFNKGTDDNKDKHTYDGLIEGHTYIFLEFNDGLGKDNSKSFDKLDATELVDVYTAGDGLKLENNKFSIKLNGSSKYLSIDSISKELTFNDSKIETEIDTRITNKLDLLDGTPSNDAANSGDKASPQIKVQVTQVDGKVTAVAVTAPEFAEPADVETAKTGLIGTDSDDSAANTIKGAKKYAEEKASAALESAKTYTNGEIQKLDADLTQEAVPSAESSKPVTGLALHVKQENGKVTEFSGSMNWCEW